MSKAMNKDICMEVRLDMDSLAFEISKTLSTDELCKFVGNIVEEYCDMGVDEALFLAQLKNMVSLITQCPEDYAGTKWEMVAAMKGLLDD